MATLYLRKLYSSFVPMDQASADIMDDMKMNGEYRAEITRPRNLGFHRKFFALLDVAFDAWEMPVTEYKGVPLEKDREEFRSNLIILAGYRKIVTNIDGSVKYKAKSIKFSKMDEIEFQALYNSVVNVVLSRVLTNYTRDDLDQVVEKIMRF